MAKNFGSDWVAQRYDVTLSPFGEEVANLLGELYDGIYHLPEVTLKTLGKRDWSDERYISIVVPDDNYSTYDGSLLTRLVLLCHDRCIRCEVEAARNGFLRLVFSKRDRMEKGFSTYHPFLEETVANWRKEHIRPDEPLNLNAEWMQKAWALVDAAPGGDWMACLGSGEHLMTGIKAEFPDGSTVFIADCLPEYILKTDRVPKDHLPTMAFLIASRRLVIKLLEEVNNLRSMRKMHQKEWQLENLGAFMRRVFAHSAGREHPLKQTGLDMLQRYGLSGSILRDSGDSENADV
jgi:hypothetical protein